VIVDKKLSTIRLPGRLPVPAIIGSLPARVMAQAKVAGAT